MGEMIQTFDGKVALITGAAGIIGRATAAVLAQRGAAIAAVERPGADFSTLRQVLPADTRLILIEADVSQEQDVRRYVETTCAELGRIDIFFNNAGIEGPTAPLVDYPVAEFRRVLEVNVVGVFLGLQAVMPIMIRQGAGSIINTSSIYGLKGSTAVSGYVASKHAVLGLTRGAAMEGAAQGVRVNSIHPGFIDSRMLSDLAACRGGNTTELASRVPSKRLGMPEEVARAVAFLAGEDSSYMNGGSLVVDGALTV